MKKKILAIHGSSELYGSDRIFLTCIKFLELEGYKVDVILKNHGPLVNFFDTETEANIFIKPNLPVAIKSLLSFKSLFNFFQNNILFYFYLLKKRKQYDIIYINTLALFTIPLLSKCAFYKKIIMHSHEMIGSHGFLQRIIISTTLLSSDRVLCVSNAVKDNMNKYSFIKFYNNKCKVIHNGINDIYNKNYIVKRDSSHINFLLLGRIMPEKGHWFLIETLKKIDIATLNKIKIYVVGTPPPNRMYLLNDLLNLIKKNDLEKQIEILDFIPNPSTLIQQSDICLIPSIIEDSLPTTVIEAMCCEKAVITTNNGGAKELIINEINGLLIEANNINHFKKAIMFYVDNPSKILIHGKNSRKQYLEKFKIEDFKNKFLEGIL